MIRQWFSAVGYLSIFLMPVLFLIGAVTDSPWLAFGVVVLVFPLARVAFGALPATGAPEWNETVATFLDRLPLAYAASLPICLVAGLTVADTPLSGDAAALLGFGLSLWMTLLFGTCVAHELIHRRDKNQAMLGHLLAGICGYPALGMEHFGHHARPGDTRLAEYPLKAESVWAFAGRRMWRVLIELFGPTAPVWSPHAQMPILVRTRMALLATTLTWAIFGASAGWLGVGLYLLMMVGVAFGIQLITYIQHWGLGDDSIPDRIAHGRGWEEDCRFQAWVTLSISLHDEHHRDSRRPYYRLDLAPDSPRLPAGYVLLMFASLIPWVWRRVMTPAHQHWLARPGSPLSAGRRLTCFGLHELRAPTSH
jgi:fatty acid desaturase